MNNYGVILFNTSSSAMQAEAVLVKSRLLVKLIPTPRELSSDCGVALRFDWDLKDEVFTLLNKMRVDMAGIYPLAAR